MTHIVTNVHCSKLQDSKSLAPGDTQMQNLFRNRVDIADKDIEKDDAGGTGDQRRKFNANSM